MRFAGIDVAAERHYVAIVDEAGAVLQRATAFFEDVDGHRQLRELLGSPDGCLVAMEATGHYWRNLFAFLNAEGFAIASTDHFNGQAPKHSRKCLSQTPLSVEQRQVELAEPLRVAEDVDLGDLAAADRERHDRERLSFERADQTSGAVDKCWEPDQAEAREG